MEGSIADLAERLEEKITKLSERTEANFKKTESNFKKLKQGQDRTEKTLKGLVETFEKSFEFLKNSHIELMKEQESQKASIVGYSTRLEVLESAVYDQQEKIKEIKSSTDSFSWCLQSLGDADLKQRMEKLRDEDRSLPRNP
jgi:ferritin-like metal-binding protein YciE